jgi:hypothetical protein
MRPLRLSTLTIACFSFVILLANVAGADTIVLKNGRRIRALSVTEEGDKIHYETPAGTLTLPSGKRN